MPCNNADDTWEPEFLGAMPAALDGAPDVGIAYCGWQNLGLGGGHNDPFLPPDYETEGKVAALLDHCRWPIHAALVRTRLVHDSGRFDETLSACVHRLLRVPHVLAYYHHHHGGEQITRDRARIALNHWRAKRKYLRAHPGWARQEACARPDRGRAPPARLRQLLETRPARRAKHFSRRHATRLWHIERLDPHAARLAAGILAPQAAPAEGLAFTTDTTQRWTTLTPPPEPACHRAPTENAPR